MFVDSVWSRHHGQQLRISPSRHPALIAAEGPSECYFFILYAVHSTSEEVPKVLHAEPNQPYVFEMYPWLAASARLFSSTNARSFSKMVSERVRKLGKVRSCPPPIQHLRVQGFERELILQVIQFIFFLLGAGLQRDYQRASKKPQLTLGHALPNFWCLVYSSK